MKHKMDAQQYFCKISKPTPYKIKADKTDAALRYVVQNMVVIFTHTCISLCLRDKTSSEEESYRWFVLRTQSMAQAVLCAIEAFISNQA